MKTIPRIISNSILEKEIPLIKGKVLNLGSKKDRYSILFEECDVVSNDFYVESAELNFDVNKKFPLDPDSFDCVFAMSLLEHLFEPQNMLNESRRILKKDGILIFSAPFIYQYHRDPYDCFRFAKDGVEYMLKKAGFERYEIIEVGGRYSVLAEYFRNILPFLPWHWLIPLLIYLDNSLLSKSEKEIGKRWHFGYFVKAYKD